MSGTTKVALAGASGNLGPAILDQLVKAGYQVTVLTRQSSSHKFPSSVVVKPVDYESLESLSSALAGQDAVVSTLGSNVLDKQLLLVEAAARAHVKRFIPSEFGSDTARENTGALPVFQPKVTVQNALKKHISSGLSYTLVVNGPFLDWGISVGFVLSAKEKSVTLYDGGNRTFSTTTLPDIGRAVVGVLKHPEETKNRAVYIQSYATTLKSLASIAKKALGSEGWTEKVASVDDIVAGAWEELKKAQPNPDKFALQFIIASIWGEGYGSNFEAYHKLDNELLGIKQLTQHELEELIKSLA
ncbi:hypothetical protein MFRU_003g04790 [Monilinia fructicola]|uniref:NmrA-like domain-containing protein n=1 Tax=Monilinia fructicola TaxID=38448 RepID=A0A5M9JS22_MONFR|nr:hypothetical protein EYC84_002920 [Monilinia fructicola]KAG4034519.1 hypothetical protein MFRU_003g04790 [Monilinia fructicola]